MFFLVHITNSWSQTDVFHISYQTVFFIYVFDFLKWNPILPESIQDVCRGWYVHQELTHSKRNPKKNKQTKKKKKEKTTNKTHLVAEDPQIQCLDSKWIWVSLWKNVPSVIDISVNKRRVKWIYVWNSYWFSCKVRDFMVHKTIMIKLSNTSLIKKKNKWSLKGLWNYKNE